MSTIIGMGVLNVTPDSFSDPGELLSSSALTERLMLMQQNGIKWFDVGAQSTAPGRLACGAEKEWSRLQNFLSCNAQIPEHSLLSIDSYWPQVAWRFTEYFTHHHERQKIIWNDVSGVIDYDTHRYLEHFKNAGVVVGLAPVTAERSQAQTHWQREDFFNCDNVAEQAQLFFHKVRHQMAPYGDRLWLDPLFGFGKDEESNWALWHALDDIFVPGDQVVIGISRKRFLRQQVGRQSVLSGVDLIRASDCLQVSLLQELQKRWQGKWGKEAPTLAVRIHDPTLLPALKSSTTI